MAPWLEMYTNYDSMLRFNVLQEAFDLDSSHHNLQHWM